ncbi:MAG TPA: hypothetical protein OIM48_00475 [Clostridiaceae bacterium]|nr:hypothetical protein [Clostridiaceae bacterium]
MNIKKYKEMYNHLLKRYQDGINYITNNPDKADDYVEDINEMQSVAEFFLKEIMRKQNVSKDEILGGFKIEQ